MNSFRSLSRKLFFLKNVSKICRRYTSDLYEPDYLETLTSKVPLYDTLNVQLTGYDYPVLENYQKFIHNLAKNMEIEVEECWATPAQHIQVVSYKPNSEIVGAQYLLKLYQRTVQIVDVQSTQLPIFLRAVEASIPPGVTVDIVNHEDWHEDIRYVPDKELMQLKQQLEDLGGPKKKK